MQVEEYYPPFGAINIIAIIDYTNHPSAVIIIPFPRRYHH
jgi:hypothetical protein